VPPYNRSNDVPGHCSVSQSRGQWWSADSARRVCLSSDASFVTFITGLTRDRTYPADSSQTWRDSWTLARSSVNWRWRRSRGTLPSCAGRWVYEDELPSGGCFHTTPTAQYRTMNNNYTGSSTTINMGQTSPPDPFSFPFLQLLIPFLCPSPLTSSVP